MNAPVNLEKQLSQVTANLAETREMLQEHGTKFMAELEKNGKVSAEAVQKVDELMLKSSELKGRLDSVEQIVAGLESGERAEKPQSMGQIFASKDEVRDFAANLRGGRSVSIDLPSADITSTSTSSGTLIDEYRRPGIVPPSQQALRIKDIMDVQVLSGTNAVEFVRESTTGFTNNAAPVSENPASVKPESNIQFEVVTESVKTVAHWIHASRQVLDDMTMLSSYIDGRLRYGTLLKEEAQILNGSGAGLNMNGVITQATAYSDPGVPTTNDQMMDTLRIALLQVELADEMPDGIVLHPVEWATIQLLKNSQANYLVGAPQGGFAPTLWGHPVVASKSITQGDFLVGAFRTGATYWQRESVNVAVSTEDRDNFVRNMVTILAELRGAVTVYKPRAFVTGTLPGLSS